VKIKAVFFDLDDTLFDCFNQCVLAAYREAAAAMVKAGMSAEAGEAYRMRLEIHGKNPGCDIDETLAGRFECPNPAAVIRAGRDAFLRRRVGPLEPFSGVVEMLERLRSNYFVFLVTTGDSSTQAEKVSRLGFKNSFHEIAYVDSETGATKKRAFWHLAGKFKVRPAECVTVGDRVDREIRDGREMGMKTVRISGGEFAALEPREKIETPDYVLKNVVGLENLLLDIERV
jgi:FMN phosphatase YigB (HAD superfamily)